MFDPETCRQCELAASEDYLFWDAQHRTSSVHQRLADYIYSLISKQSIYTAGSLAVRRVLHRHGSSRQ